MKKLYIGAAITAVAVGVNFGSVMAADQTISIDLGGETISYPYILSGEVNANSVKEIFTILGDADAEEPIESEMSVTSGSQESVEIGLRLAVDEADENDEFSVLDYYTFKITDTDGNVVYDSADEEPTAADALEKNIPLGIYNRDSAEETVDYIIEIGINKEVADTVMQEEADAVDIQLTAVSENAAVAPTETPAAPTLRPKFEIASSAADTPASEAATAAPTETVSEAPTETPTEAPAETKEKKIICGEDIEPGRYTVTGNANVRITTADGELISETTVTDGTVPDIKGVAQFITSIEKGNVITITPISDDVKAAVNFERTNSGSSTRTATAASSSRSTPAPTASSKTNPKTGDAASTTAILGAVMGVSAAAAGSLEIIKRRKKTDK